MNKILIGFIAVVVIIGAAIVIISNKSTTQTTTNPQTIPVVSQSIRPSGTYVRPSPPVATQTITATKAGFSPASITVKVNTRVVWLNKSGGTVTVNSNDYPTNKIYPPLNLGEFEDGSSVQMVFDKPGTYGYHNHLKPDQKGIVVVE